MTICKEDLNHSKKIVKAGKQLLEILEKLKKEYPDHPIVSSWQTKDLIDKLPDFIEKFEKIINHIHN
jgi:hypothetical protein